MNQRSVQQLNPHKDQEFQRVLNMVPVMIWISDADKLCTYFNQSWLDFTGRPLQAELGNGWSDGVHPDDLMYCLDRYTTAFDRRELFQMEYRLRRTDGQYRWILDSGVPRFGPDGSFDGYIGSAIDITQHKLAEAALSSVSQRLIHAQEEERKWIAREMHDDISQRITLLMMNLKGLCDQTSLNKVRDGIHTVIQETSDLAREVQTLSHRLHSPTLDFIGLEAAASACCTELARQHKVPITLRAENIPPDLSRDVSICLFRVLQEALQNAIKHSGSTDLRVLLKRGTRGIDLVVSDTGIGFDPEQAFKGQGLGLSSMKERLKLVNGTVTIDSELGRGTTIRAWVPAGATTSLQRNDLEKVGDQDSMARASTQVTHQHDGEADF